MTPFNFSRLNHRQKLAASLSGLGLTPGNLALETKLPAGVVDTALTVMAPSPLKNLTSVSLTAPSVRSGILAPESKSGLFTAASTSQLDLRPGTGADPQPYTRQSGSQVNLQPDVLKKSPGGRYTPADGVPSPQPSTDGFQAATGWMSKGPMNSVPSTKGSFLQPPVEPPKTEDVGRSMVPKAVDILGSGKGSGSGSGSGSDAAPDASGPGSSLPPWMQEDMRRLMNPVPAPKPSISPLLIGGGVLALGLIAYLAFKK